MTRHRCWSYDACIKEYTIKSVSAPGQRENDGLRSALKEKLYNRKAPDKSVSDPSEVEAIVREWFRTYSEKDFEAHNALIHPDAVVVYPEMCFVDPDMSGGKAFLEKTLEKDGANFIDLKQTITNLWVVGNTAFVEGYFSGSKLGGTIVDQAEGSRSNWDWKIRPSKIRSHRG